MLRTSLLGLSTGRLAAAASGRAAAAVRLQPRLTSCSPLVSQIRLLSVTRRAFLQKNPEKVTTTSTTTPISTGVHADSRSPLMPESPSPGSQLVNELKGVAKLVEGVPQPALIVGLAGTLPYLGTALGSLYLSWNLQRVHKEYDGSFTEKLVMFDQGTAESLLHFAQTLQVGYGACILSFLGAIHWGLEIAGYGGQLGIKRYLYGAAPALVAWPSILMPIEFALVAHFITFTGIWFFDASATRQGFTPPWYNQYRFLLTFIVCTSILLTLIVSGWLGDPQLRSANASRLDDLRHQEAKQLQVDDKKTIAAKRKANANDDRVKRQGETQEELNEKEKDAQKKDAKQGKAMHEGKNDGDDEDGDDDGEPEEGATKKKAPKAGDADIDQNGDKAGGKKGSQAPEGSAEKTKETANSKDPVAEKGGGKTTSKKDSDRQATEGKGATKAADKGK